MVRARLMPVSIMAFLLAGCASEGVNAPPPGLPHAAATRSVARPTGRLSRSISVLRQCFPWSHQLRMSAWLCGSRSNG